MLLTITYTGRNTSDLGFLLYKNPDRSQMFELSHGNAYVFYPKVSDEQTTAALLLDIDPIDLVRGKGSNPGSLFDYVNDRPYVWASETAEKYGYAVRFSEIGDSDETLGAPAQMGVFTKCE